METRIGFGWDSHAFKAGIPLRIGGMTLDHPEGLAGHSDGVVAERAVALPPLDRDTAREMVAGLRVARLLDGYRGSPPADVDALVEVVVALGQLAVELGDQLEAADLNPVLVAPAGRGAHVVDALLLPR